ncbi:hypothetical protein N7481_006769 [Penicillium waksmanii]|uniref:uncharacterized protein n=1 Tax=Penicillium waksmanii TaxID=69791 RepID=UPI0025479B9E|nr:uncharacterized protein N7481_006769 [Penicillium waksmanii]KAJ5984670.1 hypothetical protein N7481_006769 [Penicillium waksmanii]
MSLIENEGLGSVLKTEVPKVGLRHPFVMHSILAISALHLSRHCSEPRRQVYIDIGVRYHSNALTLFIPLLSDVTLENCDGLFACSFLVSSFSFALQCLDTQAPSILMSKVIEVFKLVRGTASIAASARPWIEQGDMRPILKLTQCAQRTALSRHVHEVHGRLEAIINHQADEHCPAQLSASTRAVVVRSTGHLLEIFDFSIASDNQAAILAWPAIIDAEYFQLLRQIEPMSLVTLAHYGAILHIMTSTWWMAGWGKFLVNVAAAYLNETVRSEITWPLGIVNDTSDT